MSNKLPVLYTLIRCPYAMRARLALAYAKINFEAREVDLKNKPAHLLKISPKGTVPVLLLPDNTVLEQSLDIMRWALPEFTTDAVMEALIAANDNSFTKSLNHYKYPNRYPDDPNSVQFYRSQCEDFLAPLEQRLAQTEFLFGDKLSLADLALFPFVRQFSIVDPDWFASAPYLQLRNWLATISSMELYNIAMLKHVLWVGDELN